MGVGLATRKSFPAQYTSNALRQVYAKGCRDILSWINQLEYAIPAPLSETKKVDDAGAYTN